MTPTQAHEILDNWKNGVQQYLESIITAALMATGDLTNSLS